MKRLPARERKLNELTELVKRLASARDQTQDPRLRKAKEPLTGVIRHVIGSKTLYYEHDEVMYRWELERGNDHISGRHAWDAVSPREGDTFAALWNDYEWIIVTQSPIRFPIDDGIYVQPASMPTAGPIIGRGNYA